jgi:predicted AlkP superfamily pyrophosphatase or phosphodiesterase
MSADRWFTEMADEGPNMQIAALSLPSREDRMQTISSGFPVTKVSRRIFCLLATLLFIIASTRSSVAAPVLMVSIDGMKPEYVTQADSKGLRLPFLQSLVKEGVYADGVIGVWPTVTYPSHTTLLTGMSPADHGIYNNLVFDPQRTFSGAWAWYAQQIRVPTLWQAAHDAGLRTASVGWPVSVGATSVDWLIPEYWRTSPSQSLNASDRDLMAALSRPDAMLDQMQQELGPYMMGNDTSLNGDKIKTRYALDILRKHKPDFMTIHLSSLDEAEHMYGPFSAEANHDLEGIDAMVSQLADAARANDPSTVVLVVSDHGFAPITHELNLFLPFVQAGLIQTTVNPETKTVTISSWKAQPWLAGGMAAIIVHHAGNDAEDRQTEQQVGALLQKLAADANNGIAAVLDREEVKKRGGFPDAAFLVVLKLGYYTGGSLTGNLVNVIPGARGSHGFSPEFPEMRASFFLAGPGVAHHRDLGLIDMRQIAPTVAELLGVRMPTAKATLLNVKP